MKYPRTYHLPNSPGKTKDDRVLKTLKYLKTRNLVATEKMDGENTTMTRDHIWARSMNSSDHPSRHFVKGLWAAKKHNIPKGFRVCGENLHYKKSIHYKNLEAFFQVFSVWDGNICLHYEDTLDFCAMCELTPVKTLFELHMRPGPNIDEIVCANILDCYNQTIAHRTEDDDPIEGFVIRPIGEFMYNDFNKMVGKYVRANHVQTDKHWMHQELIKNILREK